MSVISRLNRMLSHDSKLLRVALFVYNHLPFQNSYRLHGNSIRVRCSMLKKCRVTIVGSGNVILIHKGCRLKNCKFYIRGNHNTIELSESVSAVNAEFYIEDDNNVISVGNQTEFCGRIHLACTEGCKICIGSDCLFSSDIVLRTGDSHSILDMNHNRINASKNIVIGNHVWVGYRALVNKGVIVAENSIIGTGAIVTKQFDQKNVILAGVPARVIRENVTWIGQRIYLSGID